MIEDELKKEIELEFKEQFPELDVVKNHQQYKIFETQLLAFLNTFRQNEMFVYMESRDTSQPIAQHIADIPQGIPYFESWFNSGLLEFAQDTLNNLKQTLPEDKVYLTFSLFLDDQDIGKFIKKSKISSVDEETIKQIFSPFLNKKIPEIFMQAMSCMYVGLDNSAKTLLKYWIQSLWFDGDNIQKNIDDAKRIVTIREENSKKGKSGSKVRWTPNSLTKDYAIKLMHQGTYKNPSQAADAISLKVINYGKTVGRNFTSDFQSQRTIYNWLLQDLKS